MSNPLNTLIKIIDYKIARHERILEQEDYTEEALKNKIIEAIDNKEKGKINTIILVEDLTRAKDKIIFHQAAKATLEDLKEIIESAIEMNKGNKNE